jgi:4-oxalocrotonate tautomerase
MPFIHVSLAGEPNAVLSAAIAKEITELTRSHLHKDPAVTAVAIDHIAPEHWFAGGKSLAGENAKSFWLDIKVTDASNTKPEMAGYVQAVFAAMGRLLGAVHEESYILVHAVPAGAYGYGGKTQEFRYIAQQLKQAA